MVLNTQCVNTAQLQSYTGYTLCILTYGATHRCAPNYITNLVIPTSAMSDRSHVHSASSLTFNIPQTQTRMSDCALSVAGNALPADIRCVSTTQSGHF